ncbi:PepSY domain-containing protein [Rhodopseudomonas sp. WA056]|uniref:PepSY-associated TM helix domain-containing protein n=1 Tax=Rhodopseudomonas sp. WA056 TaxID=2269367 RepID=UPI0013DF7814|nr:PepSY-associated TM helix domain-containing protein [Rhodopseudomonas sp. WA056]NEW87522.1 PepSY domain-containing protein [Rhodopseudomonas sp. WA056]
MPHDQRAASRGIRQSMSGLHTWSGLLLGWVLYAMFLTGTVSFFREELSQWMRPEQPRLVQALDPARVAQRVADEIGRIAPGATQWSMKLPDGRSNTVYAFWRLPGGQGARAFGEGHFDPVTGHRIEARGTLGGDFFYRFHFQFYYMSPFWGRLLAGLAAMSMLVAIVAGVITHKKIFTDFFTFRWGKGQRAWLDAHNALSVFGLPFHVMITYTGLVTLMALYVPWGERAAIKTPAERQQLAAELNAFIQAGKPSGEKVQPGSIEAMVRQAQQRWGTTDVGRVNAANPGDATARIAVTRGDAGRVSMSPEYIEFDGVTGKLLAVHDHVGAAAETRGVMYALHLGRFSDLETRWLYFLASLMGTAMVGTGLVMWTVKRRQKLPDPERPHVGFRLVERLNIAGIAGLSVAMTALLWANRLLPVQMQERAFWEVHLFFIVWGLTLLHALLRPAKAAWVEQLWAAAALLALIPVLNAATTQRPLWHSLAVGDWVFAGTDLMCLALALLHAVLAIRTARHGAQLRPKGRSAKRGEMPAMSGEAAT